MASAEDALARFSEFPPAVLIADVELPGMDGLELLARLGEELQNVPAIIITGKGSEERAVAAIEAGAFWYIEKPLKGCRAARAARPRAGQGARPAAGGGADAATARSRPHRRTGRAVAKPMQDVMRVVEQVAPSSASVLITGETGSGKEILARTIHQLSPRADRPFRGHQLLGDSGIADGERNFRARDAAPSPARPSGASAVSSWPTAARCCWTKSARCPRRRRPSCCACWRTTRCGAWAAKSETPVDVRVLAATNKDPEQAVAKGELRQDLYFRLNVFHIQLPPLRDRKEDMPLLVEHMLRDLNAKHGRQVRGDQCRSQRTFRELCLAGQRARTAQRAGARRDRLRPRPDRPRPPAGGLRARATRLAASELSSLRFPLGTTVDAVERELILQTLAATNNKTRAAELLGISLKTLHNKLKEYEAAQNAPRS